MSASTLWCSGGGSGVMYGARCYVFYNLIGPTVANGSGDLDLLGR